MSVSRVDGRGNEDLRLLNIVYEKLGRVDGSARFGFGTFPSMNTATNASRLIVVFV